MHFDDRTVLNMTLVFNLRKYNTAAVVRQNAGVKEDVLDPNQRGLSCAKLFSGALSPSAVASGLRQIKEMWHCCREWHSNSRSSLNNKTDGKSFHQRV